jgi:hypothetical protein
MWQKNRFRKRYSDIGSEKVQDQPGYNWNTMLSAKDEKASGFAITDPRILGMFAHLG